MALAAVLTGALGGCGREATTGLVPVEDYCGASLQSGLDAIFAPASCDTLSAPSILLEGSQFRMWYSCGDRVIRGATSSDGSAWSDLGDLFAAGGRTWNANGAFSPTVVRRDTVYHLWYTARDDGDTLSIGHAISSDGLTWNADRDSVFDQARDPCVRWDGTRFTLWFASTRPPYGILRTTSSDGIRWTSPQTVLTPASAWERRGLAAPAVLERGGQFHLWYQGRDEDGALARIGYARSADGFSWTRCGQNPVLESGTAAWNSAGALDPAPVVVDGRVRVYHAGVAAGGATVPSAIGYAIALPNCLTGDCFGR